MKIHVLFAIVGVKWHKCVQYKSNYINNMNAFM